MKSKKKAIRLPDSERILEHPSGEIDINILEGLLYSITIEKIKSSESIVITHEKRARDYSPENPSWETFELKRRVSYLRKLYKETSGIDYVQPTQEQMKRGYLRQAMNGRGD